MTGSETKTRRNSSSILVTLSTTPFRNKGSEFPKLGLDREDKPAAGEVEREEKPLGGERRDTSEDEDSREFKRLELSDIKDGADKNGRERSVGLLSIEDKISARDAKQLGMSLAEKSSSFSATEEFGMSMAEKFSSFSATKDSGMSGADSDSDITSEISLTAKVAGPVGMIVELAPVLPGVKNKGTVKDKLNSIDKSKETDSAILSVNLEKKIEKIDKLLSQKLNKTKNCSQSNKYAKIF